jgi:hypothetical protein
MSGIGGSLAKKNIIRIPLLFPTCVICIQLDSSARHFTVSVVACEFTSSHIQARSDEHVYDDVAASECEPQNRSIKI